MTKADLLNRKLNTLDEIKDLVEHTTHSEPYVTNVLLRIKDKIEIITELALNNSKD